VSGSIVWALACWCRTTSTRRLVMAEPPTPVSLSMCGGGGLSATAGSTSGDHSSSPAYKEATTADAGVHDLEAPREAPNGIRVKADFFTPTRKRYDRVSVSPLRISIPLKRPAGHGQQSATGLETSRRRRAPALHRLHVEAYCSAASMEKFPTICRACCEPGLIRCETGRTTRAVRSLPGLLFFFAGDIAYDSVGAGGIQQSRFLQDVDGPALRI